MSKKSNNLNIKQILVLIFIILSMFLGFFNITPQEILENYKQEAVDTYIDISDIPQYSGDLYVTINNNIPYFFEEDYTQEGFEKYSSLDSLGRCGPAYANICLDIMPDDSEERESISSVKPTGWEQTKYDGEYLYNRCHLIGYQLSGENANKLNLITGTEYFNVQGMLPFENEVANYIESNEDNHVLYRVTPIFDGDNLLATGVQMEAFSVEDNGEGVCFNVFVYNVKPGIEIDYETGENWKE